MLRSHGPENMKEDEDVIGRNYKPIYGMILGAAPVIAAVYTSDIKWVCAAGFAIALPLLNEANSRLHDLCIRLRRTNALVADELLEKHGDSGIPSTQPTWKERG